MKALSRGVLIAGCAVSGSVAGAMPSPVWHGATHFGFDCAIDGMDAAQSQRFCHGLASVGAEKLGLPYRTTSGPDGVTLRVQLHQNAGQLAGTVVAIRPALRGETDETSPVIPLSLDAAVPAPGFARALQSLRTPSIGLRSRPIANFITS